MIKTAMSVPTLVAVTSLAVVNAVLFTSALPLFIFLHTA